jgi:pimeloyl-ACP methyl ester carboxylesterase
VASDGVEIEVHVAGERGRPALLAVNPIGMPLDQPFQPFQKAPLDLSAARLVKDGLELLEWLGPNRIHLAGWCTGARTALRLAAAAPDRIESLVLLNGAYNLGRAELTTSYQRALTATLARVVQNPELSSLYLRLLASARWDEAPESRVGSILSVVDPEVRALANLPFSSAPNLVNYARLIHDFDRDRSIDWLREVETPSLVVTGAEDRITHPEESRLLSRVLPQAELCQVEGGHFAIYKSLPALADPLTRFWQ